MPDQWDRIVNESLQIYGPEEIGPVYFSVNWHDQFKEEAPEVTTISAGRHVLVEVHGLPDGQKEFTYYTTYDVQIGQQVQVPAPEWSIRVTGRDSLPGFVLGLSVEQYNLETPIRDILPATTQSDNNSVKELIDRWEKDAEEFDRQAKYHDQASLEADLQATEVHLRIAQLKHAAGI